MPFIRRTSAFDDFHKTVSVATETELKRMRVRLSQQHPHYDAKLRMIDKRIAIFHGFTGA